MAHFAEINDEGLVLRVIALNNEILIDQNGVESEEKGVEFCRNLFGGHWLQASYNATFRKNFPGPGYRFDSDLNAFIPPKEFESWVLDETTCRWFPPIPMPDLGIALQWNEQINNWEPLNGNN
jgi:hypothetical protein